MSAPTSVPTPCRCHALSLSCSFCLGCFLLPLPHLICLALTYPVPSSTSITSSWGPSTSWAESFYTHSYIQCTKESMCRSERKIERVGVCQGLHRRTGELLPPHTETYGNHAHERAWFLSLLLQRSRKARLRSDGRAYSRRMLTGS